MADTPSLPPRRRVRLSSPPAIPTHPAFHRLAPLMTLIGGMVRFEMFIDEEMFTAFKTGLVAWFDPDDGTGWRGDGIDPSVFGSRPNLTSEVPMKQWCEDHRIALKYVALSHRGGMVTGPPTYLISGKLPEHASHAHLLREEIRVHAGRCAYGFALPMSVTNYPRLQWDIGAIFDDCQAKTLLESGYYVL